MTPYCVPRETSLEAVRIGVGAPDDVILAEAAASALTWYRAVPPGAVHVNVCNGWVTLTGTVAGLSERGAAERAIRHLRGVRGVSNAVLIRQPFRPAPMAER
jgi:osmotically-inducible protein OsmY